MNNSHQPNPKEHGPASFSNDECRCEDCLDAKAFWEEQDYNDYKNTKAWREQHDKDWQEEVTDVLRNMDLASY